MKKLQIIFPVLVMLILSREVAWASEPASKSSATFVETSSARGQDSRVESLQSYLEQRDSPLAPYAKDFVEQADKYQLDWKLLPAIAGLESGFGKEIPYGSYNAWGWGIYGKNVLGFNSWPEAIQTISKGLREGYLRDNPDSDPYVIGPSYAASPTWAVRVSGFMYSIEAYSLRDPKSSLSLAL